MHYDKNFRELDQKEVIAIHLDRGGPSFTTDFLIESTLGVILRETRHCINFNNANKIMPSLGSFALLDQVGNSYYRSGEKPYQEAAQDAKANDSAIKKALYYFGGFGANDAATKSIYAFRNALVHNASLKNEWKGVHHCFRHDSSVSSVVVPAAQPWNGQMDTLDDNTITLVNPTRLVELVTKMVDTLNECLETGTLKTELTISDLVGNYLLLIRR